MADWYQRVLNAEIVREFPHAVFMTYDEEHHRLAFVSLPGGVDFSQIDMMLSYRFGLVWEPTEIQSYYFSYGTSFNPSAETFALSTATVNLDPEENRNFEVGAKVDLFNDRLSATAALFRLEKTNARTPDPMDSTRNILAGEQRTLLHYGVIQISSLRV
jgi:outer membrane receptor for monomeric catechols